MIKSKGITKSITPLESLEISNEAKSLALRHNLEIEYDPVRLKTFRTTYSHLLKDNRQAQIVVVNNYRGNFRDSSGNFTLDGELANPGTANLHMFFPQISFEENMKLVMPPVDTEWVKYLTEAGIFSQKMSVENKVIEVRLPAMNASPIEQLLTDSISSDIPLGSLLITNFNDAVTKKLTQKRKLIHNQAGINSYEGNSKIKQRNSLLPMPPSIVVTNKHEVKKAVQKLIKLGIKKVWVKCGNNVGAGQFMSAITLDQPTPSFEKVLSVVTNIHNQQLKLMDLESSSDDSFPHAEIMIETDIHQFGKVLLEGSVYLVNDSADKSTICHYACQVKDKTDISKAIGGMSFIPHQDSIEVFFPNLMQQVAVYVALLQKDRGYRGVSGADLFIVEMNRKQYDYYCQLATEVGLDQERIPTQRLNNKYLVAVLGEINEREPVTIPAHRLALNLKSDEYMSTTLSNLPEGFDFTDLKNLVHVSGVNLSDVIPLTRKPAGLDNGVPLYAGIPAAFYVGIYGNEVHEKYQQINESVEKLRRVNNE